MCIEWFDFQVHIAHVSVFVCTSFNVLLPRGTLVYTYPIPAPAPCPLPSYSILINYWCATITIMIHSCSYCFAWKYAEDHLICCMEVQSKWFLRFNIIIGLSHSSNLIHILWFLCIGEKSSRRIVEVMIYKDYYSHFLLMFWLFHLLYLKKFIHFTCAQN